VPAPSLQHGETIFVIGLRQLHRSLTGLAKRGTWFCNMCPGADHNSLLLYDFFTEKVLDESHRPLKLSLSYAMDVRWPKNFHFFATLLY